MKKIEQIVKFFQYIDKKNNYTPKCKFENIKKKIQQIYLGEKLKMKRLSKQTKGLLTKLFYSMPTDDHRRGRLH